MSDHEIRQALLRDASVAQTQTRDKHEKRNKPNNHFLTRVVAGVDSHNGNLRRQERERADRKFGILDRFIRDEKKRDNDKQRNDKRDNGNQRNDRDRETSPRKTRFDMRPDRSTRVQKPVSSSKPSKTPKTPKTSKNSEIQFSSVVDKIVKHHKEQADKRNKIYALTSIYTPETEGLPISGLSGAEQVGTGYDEEEDYDTQPVSKKRKARKRQINVESSDDEK